jgi:RND family efflux transporter MFP subunit
MAYLAGFFEKKIPVDFKGIVPATESGQTFTLERVEEPLIEQAAGTLQAKVETIISPVITATISSIAVRSGDEVKTGDVLVKLDARELKARAEQAHQAAIAAKARLEQAEKDLKRVQRIYNADPGAVPKAEVERNNTALETARADLLRFRRQEDEAKTALSYGTLTSPIAGRIVERYADPGDTARQGQSILRMYDPGTLRLEASVRESVAAKLKKGQKLKADVDAVQKTFDVVVDEIVPSADPGSRSFLVKATLSEDTGLYPGMFGRLMVPIGQIEKMYIPSKAVTKVGQLNFVIVTSKQGSTRRFVRLGERGANDLVEVVSGLSPGEMVLIASR